MEGPHGAALELAELAAELAEHRGLVFVRLSAGEMLVEIHREPFAAAAADAASAASEGGDAPDRLGALVRRIQGVGGEAAERDEDDDHPIGV